MSEKTARVSELSWSGANPGREGVLYDPAQPEGGIPLDSPAWLAWLEAPTSSSFSFPLFDPARGYIAGFMTVRKESRQRGRSYWSVYRRREGQVRKVYLGHSTTVTYARLREIAATLRCVGEGLPSTMDL